MRTLYQAYKGEVVFLFVVVQNGPHNPPALLQEAIEKAGLTGGDAASHCSRAQLGVQTLDLPWTCVLDTPDRKVETLYDAYPERLVVVGRDGRIALDAGRGLVGPKGPGWSLDAVEEALDGLVRSTSRHVG